MKTPPTGWPRISSALYYQNAAAAIDWVVKAFGFEVRLKVEGDGGRIEHSELSLDGGLIMIGEESRAVELGRAGRSPRSVNGANTQQMCVHVDDVDAHCARARAAGAKITSEPQTTDYGDEYWADRSYEAQDLEGHRWYFMQRMRG